MKHVYFFHLQANSFAAIKILWRNMFIPADIATERLYITVPTVAFILFLKIHPRPCIFSLKISQFQFHL